MYVRLEHTNLLPSCGTTSPCPLTL
jgi:hypothetical protein